MLKIKRIINEVFNSNTFILYTDDEPSVYLIDPGNLKETLTWMNNKGKNEVKGILLTHTHFDHIYRVNDFLELYPDCILYVSSNHGKVYLADEKKNFSRYHEFPIIVSHHYIQELVNKEKFLLWNKLDITCFHTPGHSPDSVCYFVEKCLLTGDTLIENVRTVTKLRGGSKSDLFFSISDIEKLKGNNIMVYPGHNESFCLDKYYLYKSLDSNTNL